MDPTNIPSDNPTENPTQHPTNDPIEAPTTNPTTNPSAEPSIGPTSNPTENPTEHPSIVPTTDPTENPTIDPSIDPTKHPSLIPTNDPTPIPTKDIPPTKPDPPQPIRLWWTSSNDYDDHDDDDDDAEPQYIKDDMNSVISAECPRIQSMPDTWQCKRECLDIRSTEWNVELTGITQNINDGSSEWRYRVEISEKYLPDSYNHWCGYYGPSSFGPILAEINRFYIGISGCCHIPHGMIADATSYTLSYPRIDYIENGWIWEDLSITNQHIAEFILVFPHNIFAPIHGEFWIFSDDERRCVHGGTLIPDFCHFSTDYVMSGTLDLIVVHQYDDKYDDELNMQHDACHALTSYFQYDPNSFACKSQHVYDSKHRRILSEHESNTNWIAFNFTLTFNNGTLYSECIKNIKDEINNNYQTFGQIFKENFKQKTNLTVLRVSVIDLEYNDNAVGIAEDDNHTLQPIGTNIRVSIVLIILFSCIVLFSIIAAYVIKRSNNKIKIKQDLNTLQYDGDNEITETEIDNDDESNILTDESDDESQYMNNMKNCF